MKLTLMRDTLPFSVSFDAEIVSFNSYMVDLAAEFGGAQWTAEVAVDYIEGFSEEWPASRTVRVTLGRVED